MQTHRLSIRQATTRGFTLIELLIVLAVVSLLTMIAVPTVSGAVEAARAVDARSSLAMSIVAAVNRAALTGNRVVLCPSMDGHACRGDSDWSSGWLVFQDLNGNNAPDAGERIVQKQATLAGKVRLTSTSGRRRLVFQGSGSNAGSNVTFTLCDGRGPAKATALVLSNSGRLHDAKPSTGGIAATCTQ
jgi:type IV fimbrial biogenesis protein FimT